MLAVQWKLRFKTRHTNLEWTGSLKDLAEATAALAMVVEEGRDTPYIEEVTMRPVERGEVGDE